MIGLVGDIGGTSARFALAEPNGPIAGARIYDLNDCASLAEAIEIYLAEQSHSEPPVQAVLAVAAPIRDDEVAFTNYPWRFSIEDLRDRLKLRKLRVINDFAANALAIPYLAQEDRIQIGSGSPVAGSPIGIIGPGTGLGVSALVPDSRMPLQGEGGHVTMAPADARESAVLDLMRQRYDHVSAERVLSGPGLVNLYNVLCELADVPAAPFTSAQISSPQTWKEDARAREATEMFCAMLGTVAGNLALTLGAGGGIYITGGIVPKLGATFVESCFRERFEAKGRFRAYLAEIPTYMVIHPLPALMGAAALLDAA
ncbi:MAG TPA: glucokinase [Methylovirgula sp.]|nr:glucokinase [Methylovirgula sp.]